MALSDYLTSDEWDACYYAMFGQHAAANLGDSMHMTIDALLKEGYIFPGLDEQGHKKEQIRGTGNPQKIVGLFLAPDENVNVLDVLDKGRTFLKKHLPRLVDETDEEWQQQMEKARNGG